MTSVSEYTKKAKEVFKKIRYITLATVSEDGIPWNSPVWYAKDADYNLYFGSPKNTQHSQNIRANGKAFVVIYDSTAPEGTGFGVYMTAKVTELNTPEEIKKGIAAIWGKRGKDKDPKEFAGGADLRLYKVMPIEIWVNDAEMKNGNYLDYRIPIKLNG